jgi:glycosyltransferase involved in cell wall biosynthesis
VKSRERRPAVTFVGAFNSGGLPLRGGQISACMSLLESGLAEAFRFELIDSTQESVPPPPLGRRALRAARRFLKFAARMLLHLDRRALIFITDGFGFVEKGAMVLLARLVGVRVVLAPRSGLLIDDYARGPLWRWYIRTVLRAASIVVCQSPSWRDLYASWGVPAARLVVIPNWIDPGGLAAIPPPLADARAPLRLLFLAHVERAKGVFDLIEAIARLRGLADVSLVIAGSGGAMAEAQQRTRELGIENRVRFIGWVDEAGRASALASADVLVLPSYREGVPNAVLEAMAAARPAVATRVGGIPDLVEQDATGALFEAGDIDALTATLARLAADRESVVRMGIAARCRAIAAHSIDHAVVQLHSSLAGGAP